MKLECTVVKRFYKYRTYNISIFSSFREKKHAYFQLSVRSDVDGVWVLEEDRIKISMTLKKLKEMAIKSINKHERNKK